MKRRKARMEAGQEISSELGVSREEQGFNPVSAHSCGSMVKNAVVTTARRADKS